MNGRSSSHRRYVTVLCFQDSKHMAIKWSRSITRLIPLEMQESHSSFGVWKSVKKAFSWKKDLIFACIELLIVCHFFRLCYGLMDFCGLAWKPIWYLKHNSLRNIVLVLGNFLRMKLWNIPIDKVRRAFFPFLLLRDNGFLRYDKVF